MRKITYTDTDVVALLIGRQFMYGSNLKTAEKVFTTEKGKTFIVSTEGDIIQREYVDFITTVYSK